MHVSISANETSKDEQTLPLVCLALVSFASTMKFLEILFLDWRMDAYNWLLVAGEKKSRLKHT